MEQGECMSLAMKRFYLLFLMFVGFCVCSFGVTTVTKQYQASVGVSFIIDPSEDILTGRNYLGDMSGLLQINYDDRSYFPTDFVYTTETWKNTYGNIGYVFTITPQKAGTSMFHVKVIKARPEGGGVYSSYPVYDIQYTIYAVDVTKITIPTSQSLRVGETYSFSPVIEHNLAQATLSWNSDNVSVATVDETGKLTALNAGTTTITCTAQNGVSATCFVTVKPVPAESVTLDMAEKEMSVGSRLQMQATILPESGTSKTLNWESDDEAVAKVNNRGEVTAINTGTCNIIATTTDGTNLSASCKVTVINNYLYAQTKKAATGSRFTWPVSMRNEAGITAVQFDVILPTGVTIAKNTKGVLQIKKCSRCEFHEIGTSNRGSNTYRVLLYSNESELIAYDDGLLVEFILNVENTMAAGDYNIQITNMVLTTPNQTKYQPSDTYVTLNIMDAIAGDANMDGTVDVVDIVALASHILKRDTVEDYPQVDANGDGIIDVTDIVCVANIILNDSSSNNGN